MPFRNPAVQSTVFLSLALALLVGVPSQLGRAQGSGDASNATGPSQNQGASNEQESATIYFSARDAKWNLVNDLKADEMSLIVDGVPQKIEALHEPWAATPLTFELLLDDSGSMGPTRVSSADFVSAEKASAPGFFTLLMRRGDLGYVREFAEHSALLARASSDPAVLAQAVSNQPIPLGRTAILQSLLEACKGDFSGADERNKVILLVSDGADNNSKASEAQVENCLRDQNVSVYAIGVGEAFETPGAVPPGDRLPGPEQLELESLTRKSGGYVWPVRDEEGLEEAMAEAAEQIRGRYAVVFNGPPPRPDGKPHRVKLETSRKHIDLFAPTEIP
jgi:VWFA-related protein